MSEHKKTITAISWCPDNPDLFASASADNLLIVWNVAEQKAVARLDNTKGQWMIYTGLYWHTGVLNYCVYVLPSNKVSQCLLIFPRCPYVSQLVLELS